MPRVINEDISRFEGKNWFLLAIAIFLIDQISKWLILINIPLNQFKSIMPGVQLTLAYNRGVAFSWFNQRPEWGAIVLLIGVSVITLLVAGWLVRTPLSQKWEGTALSFILGGALGNLFDRVWHGHVIDFIDCYYQNWHWYTFNLADAFISIGAVMLLREVFKKGESCQMQNP